MRADRRLHAVTVIAAGAVLTSASAAVAQPRVDVPQARETVAQASSAAPQARPMSDDEREQAFVDSMRREDPATAERYIALRDARARALSEMRRAEAQYNTAGPLQAMFINAVRQARRKYAETSLALLEFFDARDKESVVRYREEIEKITGLIEERKRTRADLEKMLSP